MFSFYIDELLYFHFIILQQWEFFLESGCQLIYKIELTHKKFILAYWQIKCYVYVSLKWEKLYKTLKGRRGSYVEHHLEFHWDGMSEMRSSYTNCIIFLNSSHSKKSAFIKVVFSHLLSLQLTHKVGVRDSSSKFWIQRCLFPRLVAPPANFSLSLYG